MSDVRERFRLVQGGIPVAWSEGQSALSEIQHYAAVYRQDGPVRIEQHRGGRWRTFSPITRHTPKGNPDE